ncbi:MAG: 50S ribosomal protein L10 [Candidatus Aenigmarchaeota archaeon]|nr:50S ribosomal protein L10 [Candidatus Aenigmarchaeota archaeon]
MPKTKQQKGTMLDQLSKQLTDAKSIYFSYYRGLTVANLSELRILLKKENCSYVIPKKTLLQKVLREANVDIDLDKIKEPLAITFCKTDEIAGAKVLEEFSQQHNLLKVGSGVLFNEQEIQLLNETEVEQLSKLPNRQQLLVKLLWTLNSPLVNFLSLSRNNLSGFIRALKAISEKK